MSVPVSVVIGYYRGRDTIRRAVDSVLGQTRPPAGVVVVDDGSPEPLDPRWLPADPRVRTERHDRNRGIPGARNTGIRAATEPWVAFLDQDDEWRPDKLERQWRAVEAAATPGDTVFFSRQDIVWRDGTTVRFPSSAAIRGLAGGGAAAVRTLAGRGNCVPWNSVLLHRSVFDRFGPLDSEILGGSDDHELMLRLAAEGLAFRCADGPDQAGVIHYITGHNYSDPERFFTELGRIYRKLGSRYPVVAAQEARALARGHRDLAYHLRRAGRRREARRHLTAAMARRPGWLRLYPEWLLTLAPSPPRTRAREADAAEPPAPSSSARK